MAIAGALGISTQDERLWSQTARRRLDGLPLAVGSRTRIDDNPRAGDYVQIRGRLEPKGNVLVERLRRRAR